jgi:glycosyltransferase involved in cell wall biosynthesis
LVLEDCVDTTKFRPKLVKAKLYEQFGIPRQPKVILTIGRLSRKEQYKGHDRVMQALQTYCRDMDVCYLIVGDGDDRPRLEALAEDLGLEEWCRFPGFVADELLVDIYNLCDVFILVSEFGKGKGEGIPLVLLEASACGKPVIAGKYDGSAEAVEDGVTGYMVDSLNLQEIAQAIRSVLEDNEKAREMGLAGRRRIEELFSYEVFRDKLGRHLERLG